MNEPDIADMGERFTMRVQDAASRVLGGSEAGNEIAELCREHAAARRMLLEDRTDQQTVVAVIGATGQGKSWLSRQMVGEQARASIRSGNSLQSATEKLTWIGPKPPADLDVRHELFVACSGAKMQTIGRPYLLVDAPGATDDRRAIAEVARRALSLATVLVLVVRRDQLRSQRVTGLAEASEGTIVIPVINLVEPDDDDLQADVDALQSRLREIAPQSLIESAMMIADFDKDGRGESPIGEAAAKELGQRIADAIAESGSIEHRRGTRLAVMDSRFSAAVASVMENELPQLTAAVDRLKIAAEKLPSEVTHNLLGGTGPLQAAIRSHLRLAFLSDTSAVWFPYRSLLSLFNLTHGAWDRMFLSLSGSLPSLVGAVYASAQNIGIRGRVEQSLRSDLQERATAAVSDRLGPMARRFRAEVNQLQRSAIAMEDRFEIGDAEDTVATLTGLDMLQESSREAFENVIENGRVSRVFAVLIGMFGTLVFWALMAGPLVALYRGYFDASWISLVKVVQDPELSANLEKFPRPDASMMFTGLVLSLLPTAGIAMVALSISQSRRRVGKVAEKLRLRHDEIISRLRSDGVLRLRWSDPLLANAEFLLSVGRHPNPTTMVISDSTASSVETRADATEHLS